jgi:mycothiol synthase
MHWSVDVLEPDVGRQAPLSGLVEFESACLLADSHSPFEEHTSLSLQGQRQVPHARFTIRESGRLGGCAVLAEGLDSWSVEVATHPHYRRRGIATALLGAVRLHVASHGGGRLQHWIHEFTPAVSRLAPAAEITRTLLILRRCLDRDLPDVVGAVRHFESGTDRDAWLTLTNAAFIGHPENGGWTRQDLDWRVEAAWSDANCWPVVPDGDQLIAGVWTKVVPGSTAGELYIVAVAPHAQGRGLGLRVVGQALRDLARKGCRSAFLYVDANNDAAVALYRKAGFTDGDVHRCLQETIGVDQRSPVAPSEDVWRSVVR